MIVYAIQFTRAPLPQGVDEGDLSWEFINDAPDADEAAADEYARELDAAFDGAYLHRVVALEVDDEARPGLVKVAAAAVAAKGAA